MKEPRALKLHQALHGYADGHRQLALSATLTPRDQKTLLALSDISGPGAKPGPDGYLTGYPLSESGLYALARTWSAPEMPRPGCVWTHTLLIDFTDLARIESLASLESYFRRPIGASQVKDYTKPERLHLQGYLDHLKGPGRWGKQVVAALYGHPKKPIIAERPIAGADQTVLAIWSQQWPRLRRSFRFCTLAAAERSSDGAGFDLQLLPAGDRATKSRFGRAFDADLAGATSTWLEDAWRDLEDADADGLRSFFRQLGSDVSAGREAFQVLCRLHRLVRAFPKDTTSVQDAIAILKDELSPTQARTARTIVAAAALESVRLLDDASFDFLWEHLSLLDPAALASHAAQIGKVVWSRDPHRLASDEPLANLVAQKTLAELGISELLDGLVGAPGLSAQAVSTRPELVEHPKFWLLIDDNALAFRVAIEQRRQASAMAAMIAAGQQQLAPRAVDAFGAPAVLDAVQRAGPTPQEKLTPWVIAACADVKATSDFLAHTSSIPRSLLVAIAHVVPPDTLPNVAGKDPWVLAWRVSTGPSSPQETLHLASYFLTRAMGAVSASPSDLTRLSFEPVYRAAAANDLPVESWSMIEPRLPWSPFWFDWDRMSRLRSGLVNLILSRELAEPDFATMVSDDALFRQLAEAIGRSDKGRAYLKRVRRWLKEAGSKPLKKRGDLLDKLLG